MKRSKILLVVIAIMLVSTLFGCVSTHGYGAWSAEVKPTLTTKGVYVRYCEGCGKKDEIEVPALTDASVWTVTDTVPSTHTTQGSETYTSVYGSVVVALDLVPHTLVEYLITQDPTLTETGLAIHSCECGYSEEVVVPVLGDDTVWAVETFESTHTQNGADKYTSVYGTVIVARDLIPHEYVTYELTVTPTLTEGGKANHICACSASVEVDVPALNDTTVWTVETVESTHAVKGTDTYTSVYGTVVIERELIPHVYGDYTLTQNPTLTETGLATHACECTHSEEVVVPALGDETVWSVATVESTHTVKGTDTYTSVYGTVVVERELIPHEYATYELTVNPTLTQTGIANHICACSASVEVEVPALTDGAWTVEHTVEPKYDKDGKDTYTSVYGTVEVVVDSLVAPFDGKTYHPVNFDAEDAGAWKNGVVYADNVWSAASVTLDQYGYGAGTAYPFRGAFKFILVNAVTGEIRIESYAQKTEEVFVQDPESWDPEEGTWETIYVVDDEGNPVYDWTTPTASYTAWMDMSTGLIIAPRNDAFIDVNLYTCYEAGLVNATAVASAWDGAIAIQYTYEGTTHNIFVYDDRAYFGVSFVDLSGTAISADQCYNATNIQVLASDGSVIAGYAFDAEQGKLVVADGTEGNYVNGADALYLSGHGVAELNGNVGTYVINATNIGVYVNGEYFEVTIEGNSYTAVKPMVTISFDGGEYATSPDAVEVNKNIVITLPTLTSEQYTFKGWSLNGTIVAQDYAPSESVTLVAVWKAKVVITIEGALEGDTTTLYLGEGDVIGDYLPQYGIEAEAGKIFRGWYLDEGFEIELPEEAILSEEDVAVTIYAKWEDLPAYYGTYYGTELWNAGYGNSGGKTLTIDENGNMSGLKTGVIVDYDPETQVVQWTQSGSTKIYKFYFNAELGVIAGIYNNYDINNDFYFLSRKNPTNGKVNAYYGVKAPKAPGDSTRGWYALFVNAETDLGTREIFIYNNRIYTEFTAVDGSGNPVTAASVKNSKVVVVKDAQGNVIVSVASTGTSFANNNNTVDLDAYFGIYTNGAETVVLDGVGGIVYGDKTGTYAVSSTGEYIDIYFADPVEYYVLTLNGSSFQIEKPMVTIVLNGGAYAQDQTLSLNVNVAYTLPVYEDANNVFNGWYKDANCTQPVGESIVPTESTTIYALWKVKAVLTVVYNNGEENGEFIYSVGDEANIEAPVKAKAAFAGWFTTALPSQSAELYARRYRSAQ